VIKRKLIRRGSIIDLFVLELEISFLVLQFIRKKEKIILGMKYKYLTTKDHMTLSFANAASSVLRRLLGQAQAMYASVINVICHLGGLMFLQSISAFKNTYKIVFSICSLSK
jgi:hypothetical protein